LILEKFPPSKIRGRYGNPEYRKLFDYIENNLTTLHSTMLNIKIGDDENINQEMLVLVQELNSYFINSIGNRVRIDYGSGHELSFLCWMLCLSKDNIFLNENDRLDLVIQVFPSYLILMRKIQTIYQLEPAGSRGIYLYIKKI
jgi:serine/threonine-protein phosphatase 2A activator